MCQDRTGAADAVGGAHMGQFRVLGRRAISSDTAIWRNPLEGSARGAAGLVSAEDPAHKIADASAEIAWRPVTPRLPPSALNVTPRKQLRGTTVWTSAHVQAERGSSGRGPPCRPLPVAPADRACGPAHSVCLAGAGCRRCGRSGAVPGAWPGCRSRPKPAEKPDRTDPQRAPDVRLMSDACALVADSEPNWPARVTLDRVTA